MIEARHLTKRYGNKLAIGDLSFTVKPGIVTGFLGPNGAGKSTTMRLIVGLDAPTGGEVTVNGRNYADFSAPLREVGLLLEARSVHGGRSAYNHLSGRREAPGSARRGRLVLVSSRPPSNRACGSPAHGSPTSVAGGIRLFPPGPVGPR
jgi:ABC-2 type transport system ATP-binding protein